MSLNYQRELVIDLETKINQNKENNERAITQLKEDHKREIVRLESDNDLDVRDATKKLEDKISELEISKANYKKETEILRGAFKNLGFDVKDMKGILDKLVDGIVGKSKINVIK